MTAASAAAATRTTTPRVLHQVVMIPHERIIPDPDQPRDYFDTAAMVALKGSINHSDQKLPIVVRPHAGQDGVTHMIVDGECRWRSAVELDIPLQCIVRNDLDDPHARRRFQVLANWNRQGHTIHETVGFLSQMLQDPEIQALERKEDRYFRLGQLFGHTAVWVRKHLHLKRLHPELFARLAPDTPKSQRFPKSVAFSLSNVTHEKQLEWAEKIDTGQLNATRARRLMNNDLLKEGGKTAAGHKGRGPSDNMALFQTALRHLDFNLTEVEELDEKTFTRMIASRPVSERGVIKKQLGEAMRRLEDIKKRVEKVPNNSTYSPSGK